MAEIRPLPAIVLAALVVVAGAGVASAGPAPDYPEVEDVTIDAPEAVSLNETHTFNVTFEIGTVVEEGPTAWPEIAPSVGINPRENMSYGFYSIILKNERGVEVEPNSTVTLSYTVNLSKYTEYDGVSPGKVWYAVHVPSDQKLFTEPVTVTGSLPGDVDGDDRVEDVNGDGQFTVLDVVAFLDTFDSTNDDPARFDHTGDGAVTIRDVGALLDEV